MSAAAFFPHPIPRTFFGIQIQNFANVQPLGFGTLRVGTTWRQIERTKGSFDFSQVDPYIEAAQRLNLDVIMQLGQPPNYATGGTSSSPYGDYFNSKPPTNIQDWRNYVSVLGKRYKGKIAYYEVWNEPNLKGFYSGTVEKLVELAMEANKTLKAIDPSIRIISPSYTATSGVSGLDAFLRAGGKNWIDIVGVHLYGYPKPPEAMIDLANAYRNVMVTNGVGSLPLWNTESSWNNYYYKGVLYGSDENDYSNQMPDDLAIAYIHRMFLCNWIAGVERAVFYGMDQPWSRIRLLNLNNLPNIAPPGIAYKRMVEWLAGASGIGYSLTSTGIHSVTLTYADGQNGYVLWTDDDRTSSITLPGGIQIRQAMLADGTPLSPSTTQTVTKTPLYLKAAAVSGPMPDPDVNQVMTAELMYNHDFRLQLSATTVPVGWDPGSMPVLAYSGTAAPIGRTVITLALASQYQQFRQYLRKPLQKGAKYRLSITYQLNPSTAGKWTIGLDSGANGTTLIDNAYLELPPSSTFTTSSTEFIYDYDQPDAAPDHRVAVVNMAPTGQQQPLHIAEISLKQLSGPGIKDQHAYQILYSPVRPTAGSYKRGDLILFTDPDVILAEGIGWLCTSSGTFGKLSGVSATTAAGSSLITVTPANALRIGDTIKIGSDPNAYAVAIKRSSNQYELTAAIRTQAQTNQPVSYVPPVFERLSSLPTKKLADPSFITVGPSPFVYQNLTGAPLDVLISGGSVTAIEFSRNGTTWYDTGAKAGIIPLSPGDRLRIRYTTAPRLSAIPR